MVPAARYWSFVGVAVALIAVPGPSVLFVLSRSVAYGWRVGLRTVVGNAVGAGVQVLAISVGLGAVVQRSALAFSGLKLAGAAYLVWLGWRSWRDRRSLAVVLAESRPESAGRPSRVLLEGFAVGVTNPKLFVFFAAVLPQFVSRSAGSVSAQIAVLGLTFVVLALVCDSAWAGAAGVARSWFVRSPARLELIGGVGGLVTAGLGASLLFVGRRE